jgi:hypothetical protein
LHFFIREQHKKTTASENGKIIIYRIKKVISTKFPELFEKIEALPDNRKRKDYSSLEIITSGVFLFILKEGSRNKYNNDRMDAVFSKNYYKHFHLRMPHPDVIDEVMRVLPSDFLEVLKAELVASLIEQKCFRSFRLFGTHYLVAVDATGMQTFSERHCEHCLTKTSKNDVVTYFHYVLEAKLVTSAGHAISLATEFIENQSDINFDKQDCEQKAFVRLAKKIKKHFPRLPICILADGLYPNNTAFQIFKENNWQFIITLKEGNLKTFNEEVNLLKSTAKSYHVHRADNNKKTDMEYMYLNDIEYNKHAYSWVLCKSKETKFKDGSIEEKMFAYITNIPQGAETVITTADSGRLRWKIENEGFNTQKNLGYAMEHKYSRVSYLALKNYYQLLQIGHMINQFVEKSKDFVELLEAFSGKTIESLWLDLNVFMKTIPVTEAQKIAFFAT